MLIFWWEKKDSVPFLQQDVVQQSDSVEQNCLYVFSNIEQFHSPRDH